MERISDKKKRVVKSNGRGDRKQQPEQHYFQEFKSFILASDHPCLMAQAVLKSSNATFKVYKAFDEMETTLTLKADLDDFVSTCGSDQKKFQSFVAVFPDFRIYDEIDFEKLLWRRLQLLHDVDVKTSQWDKSVSADPADPNFSFSIGGKAFYVIGMHPDSSRISRQAPLPTMVFNLHNQFERLKDDGVYQEVRNKIRHRDYMVQGSLNPMLEDFGIESEARQYSGRAVEDDWICPFQPTSR